MKLYYKNSNGNIVDLSQWPVMYQESESLLEKEWKYNGVDSSEYGGKVKNFYRGLEEKILKISIFAEKREIFEEVMRALQQCFETDLEQMEAGRLYFNGSYLRCYIRKTVPSEWEEDFYTIDQQLTVLAEYPFWITEKEYVFKASEIITTDNKKYAYKYAYRYASGMNNTQVINEHFAECNFKIIVYGACLNPSIIIGGHRYQVNIYLEEGELLIIESREKTVKKIMNDGTIVNAFHNRARKDSVFQKIKPGRNIVKWNGQFDFDIVLYEERSEPQWN